VDVANLSRVLATKFAYLFEITTMKYQQLGKSPAFNVKEWNHDYRHLNNTTHKQNLRVHTKEFLVLIIQ